jgi:hypothetical protein
MKLTTHGLLLLSILLLPGCDTTRDVASTSFHVVTAPVRFVHRQIFGEEEEPPPPPPAATSDVVTTPGQPVAVTSPTPIRRSVAPTRAKTKTTATTATSRPPPSPPTRTASTGQSEFPAAKPVPGRPGLVYNPFDPNGGYIDVSGYAPGSKVKDPDSKKIFIVP